MRPAATVVCIGYLVLVASRAAGGREREEEGSALPPNLTIDRSLQVEVQESAEMSPTLQRQLSAIAGAPAHVSVRVSPLLLPGFRRAETAITRYRTGFIRADVAVPPGANFVELLAHELEHVLEQIEGTDLAALLRSGRASRDSAGFFETTRAQEAGRAAALELTRATRKAAP